jgi:hypothetical protein
VPYDSGLSGLALSGGTSPTNVAPTIDTANSRITPGVTGIYRITACVYLTPNVAWGLATAALNFSIYKGGVVSSPQGASAIFNTGGGAQSNPIVLDVMMSLTATTDYIELFWGLAGSNNGTMSARANLMVQKIN